MSKLPSNFGSLSSYPDAALKRKFLSMGSRMFRRVGAKLVEAGLLESSEASFNEAGIAVSGDVNATYWISEKHAVTLTMTASAFGFGGRSDGVTIYGQLREIPDTGSARRGKPGKRPWPSKDLGGNVGFRASEISDETVESFVRKCVLQHPYAEKAKSMEDARKLLEKSQVQELSPQSRISV